MCILLYIIVLLVCCYCSIVLIMIIILSTYTCTVWAAIADITTCTCWVTTTEGISQGNYHQLRYQLMATKKPKCAPLYTEQTCSIAYYDNTACMYTTHMYIVPVVNYGTSLYTFKVNFYQLAYIQNPLQNLHHLESKFNNPFVHEHCHKIE